MALIGCYWDRAFMNHPNRTVGWRQDNRNRSNQESKFDFLATRQQLRKIGDGQQKIKIVRQIYEVPANQFSPSPGTTLIGQSTGIKIAHCFENHH